MAMSENYYFEGDPATDSARRHLERVLKNDKPRRRWPWVLTVIVGASAWYFWPRGAREPRKVEAAAKQDKG
jgi:hypothetical protein